MTRGISLLCIGSPQYGKFAANMAMSLKSVSPNIPIQLIHEPHAISHLSADYLRLFDKFTTISVKDCFHNDRFDPAKAKFSLYKYLEWDETIYLDIDGVAIKDLSGLFDECQGLDFTTQIHAKASIQEKEFKAIQWAPMDVVREYYSFPDNAVIPATNTSFHYIRKSEFAERVFNACLHNFDNPIPLEKIKTWGGGQPDELYMNISLAQLGYIPDKPAYPPVYLRNRKAAGEVATADQLKENHYVIGVYGDYGYNHRSVLSMYDRLMKVYSLELLGKHQEFKVAQLMESKHVRNKR